MGETMQVAVYRIDKFLFTVNTYNDIVDEIISNLNEDEDRYFPVTVKEDYKNSFSFRLYHFENPTPPQWRNFIAKILSERSTLKKINNINHSFLLFIGYNNEIYAISGGLGSMDIDRYVSHTFGMDILSRLIAKNSPVIKYVQNRSVTGSVLGQSRFFRQDQRLSDDVQFGSIYKEVQAEIDKKLLTEVLGFQEGDLKRDVFGCLAKTSFRINKMVSFDMFLTIVSSLDEIMNKRDPNFSMNHVLLISNRYPSNHDHLKALEKAMGQHLFENYKQKKQNDFDFCHREFDKYLNASGYRVAVPEGYVHFDKISCLEDIIPELLRKESFVDDNADDFYSSLQLNIVESYDEDRRLTKGSILSHLHGEITYNGRTYFRIDGQWYEIKSSFIKELNELCKEMMEDCCEDGFFEEVFNVGDHERVFNEQFIGKEGMLVFDTLTPDGIELCDILKYSEDSLHVIHVKKGFDNRIRDLSSQVIVSARTIVSDKADGYTYLKKLQERAKRGSRKNEYLQKVATQQFPIGGLADHFKKTRGQVYYCLAFADTSGISRSLKKNIQLFNSNIAKFSILELRNQIRQLGFGFIIIQLKTNR